MSNSLPGYAERRDLAAARCGFEQMFRDPTTVENLYSARAIKDKAECLTGW
jgi:hypothetical protein